MYKSFYKSIHQRLNFTIQRRGFPTLKLQINIHLRNFYKEKTTDQIEQFIMYCIMARIEFI